MSLFFQNVESVQHSLLHLDSIFLLHLFLNLIPLSIKTKRDKSRSRKKSSYGIPFWHTVNHTFNLLSEKARIVKHLDTCQLGI